MRPLMCLLRPLLLILVTSLLFSPVRAETQTGTPRRVLIGDYSTNLIGIVDADGTLAWQYPIDAIHDLQMLPNGNVLFQTSWTDLVEMTPDKQVVWSYNARNANGNDQRDHIEVHAFQRLTNGLTMVAESGPRRIIEVDDEGAIQHQIQLNVKTSNPHCEMRMARKIEATGHYLVCHEADGTVREYDSKGNVVWEFDVPLFGREPKGGHGVEAFGNMVYGAIRLSNGNTLIATGNGHSVLEVNPEKEIVWRIEQNDLPGIQLAWVTSLAELPNGNYVFGNCHAGPENPQIIEVTREKEVVWTFQDLKNFGNSLPVSQVLDVQGVIR